MKCRKRLVDKLVEECSENIDEKEMHPNEIIYNSILNDYEKICRSCTVYILANIRLDEDVFKTSSSKRIYSP